MEYFKRECVSLLSDETLAKAIKEGERMDYSEPSDEGGTVTVTAYLHEGCIYIVGITHG
jgi:hypothetical protein